MSEHDQTDCGSCARIPDNGRLYCVRGPTCIEQRVPALGHRSANPPPDTVGGYVIERFVNSEAVYWTGRSTNQHGSAYTEGFTPDPLAAVRFLRAEDASTVLKHLLQGNGRIATHA